MLFTTIKSTVFQSVPKPLQGMVKKIYYPVAAKLRRLRGFQTKWIFHFSSPIREFEHLPSSILEGISDVATNREGSEKIKRSYFKDRLVIVPAIPKSASSVISSCIVEMMPIPQTRRKAMARYMPPLCDSDLRPALVKDFLEGGVLKCHPRATSNNLRALHLLGVKHIIILRHPIDQLTAHYCHILNSPEIEKAVRDNRCLLRNPIYPLHTRMFQPDVEVEDSLQYLICKGFLHSSLLWMVDWLKFRDQNRSLVVKYEDFIQNRDTTLNNISLFLSGKELDDDTFMKCTAIADGNKTRRLSSDSDRKYPRGWTGKIGTWKDYFSDENKKSYLSVVKGFLSCYPGVSLLLDVYPNLLDVDNLGQQ